MTYLEPNFQLGMPNSLWVATANPLPLDPLVDNTTTDALVVGGGFTGLSAALHLSEVGCDVVLVDAVEPGYGASGRNGGQVIPGLKAYPDDVMARFGNELGLSIVRTTNKSADFVFDLIEKHQIDCFANRNGFIQPAFSKPSCKVIRQRCEQLESLGAPVELLDRQSTCECLGSNAYHLALLDRRGGNVQPLAYARGLAKAAIRLGAKVFSHSPVKSIGHKNNQWVARTPSANIKCNQLLICTNGYSDFVGDDQLWPALSKSIVPLYSFQVATTPLEEKIRRTILPFGHVASDTRRLLNYFRMDQEGRLVFGGRGGVNDATGFADYDHVIKRIRQLFPQIQDPQIEYSWSGKVALTLDSIPHIHQLAPRVHAALGFNGRGVAMASMMGNWLAKIAIGQRLDEGCLPLTSLKHIRFQNFRKPAISMAYIWKSLQDRMETIPNF